VAVTVKLLSVNEAVTVQLAVIAPVVYVVPDNDPLHPEAEAVYPVSGVTVNVVVPEGATYLEAGEIVPPAPAVPVTVYAQIDPDQVVPATHVAVGVIEAS
jgi:hypothetical protein